MPISSVFTSLIFPQPSLGIKKHSSPGHVATAPLTAQSGNSQQTGLQAEEAAHCKEADSTAMTMLDIITAENYF